MNKAVSTIVKGHGHQLQVLQIALDDTRNGIGLIEFFSPSGSDKLTPVVEASVGGARIYSPIKIFIEITSASIALAAPHEPRKRSMPSSLRFARRAACLDVAPMASDGGHDPSRHIRAGRRVHVTVSFCLYGLAATNVLTSLVTALCMLLALLMLLHRLVWPALQHPIYALARWYVLRQRKLVTIAGLALITLGSSKTGTALEIVLRRFGI